MCRPAVVMTCSHLRNRKLPELRASLDRLGFGPMILMIMSLQEFAAFLAAQAQKWPPVIGSAKIDSAVLAKAPDPRAAAISRRQPPT
jgi:hypothetical protein